MHRIAVFCGSAEGSKEIYKQSAILLGKTFAVQNIELVYGGAKIGLMGALADAVLNAGGKVIGVIPRFLRNKEVAHQGLTDLILTESMHERKNKMNELSDGFIILPGGFGTLDEFFEILTWRQLSLHQKPIAILNVDGFYDSLIKLIEDLVQGGFVNEINKKMILVSGDIDELLEMMKKTN